MEKNRRRFKYKIYTLPVGGIKLWRMFMMVGHYIVEMSP